MKNKIITISLTTVFTLVFAILNSGFEVNNIYTLVKPIIFASTVVFCIFYKSYTKFFLTASLILLLLMIVAYLLDQLIISEWVGSLGFGMLVMVVFSYIPDLIKKGYIEKY